MVFFPGLAKHSYLVLSLILLLVAVLNLFSPSSSATRRREEEIIHNHHHHHDSAIVVQEKEILNKDPTTTSIKKKVKNKGNSTTVASHQQQDDNSNPPAVTFIAIASLQRSSSTFLSHNVLASHPCHVTLNEIFFPKIKQSGDAWAKEGNDLPQEKKEKYNISVAKLSSFLMEVAKRRCQEKLLNKNKNHKKQKKEETKPNKDTTQEQCSNHCYVNWKEFDIHLQRQQHQGLWEEIRPHVLILERNVMDRWKSWEFAAATGDWNTWGGQQHKEKLANWTVPPIESWFLEQHKDWYQFVRSNVQTFQLPVLEFQFDEVVQNPNQTYNQVMDLLLTTTTNRDHS